MTPDWLVYDNQGATRNQPLSPRLVDALSFLPELGVQMHVFSGGQPGIGTSDRRVGSTRHDHGNAADVFFYRDGRRLNWANEADRPVFEQIVSRGRQAGITGFGAGEGYMQPGSMHIGFGNEAVWGAGGSGANAPEWLRTAYHGAGGSNTAPAAAPSGATPRYGSAGSDPVAAPPPVSLLEVPEMQEQRRVLGGLLSEDQRDRLVMGLEGMTLNPNRALMASAAKGIEGRAEGREKAKAEREAVQRTNRTIEWLKSQGRSDLAAAVSANPGFAGDAVRVALTPQERQSRNTKVINGRLVDADTGELVADYSTQDVPAPYTDVAKATRDFRNGLISQEQYDAIVQGEGPDAPRTVTTQREDGSEVVVQWDRNKQEWVPLRAPGGATSLNAPADLTESEQRMTLFRSMQDETAPVLDSLEERYNPANIQDAAARNTPLAGNFYQTREGQQYQAAASAWAEGALRLATGAAATPEEFQRTISTYFAQPGDKPETIQFKSRMREMYTRSVRRALGERNVEGTLPDPMKFAEQMGGGPSRPTEGQTRRQNRSGGLSDEELLDMYGDN